jgi:hypothetical protein
MEKIKQQPEEDEDEPQRKRLRRSDKDDEHTTLGQFMNNTSK